MESHRVCNNRYWQEGGCWVVDMLEIKYLKIDDLIPYENNPRNNQNAVDAVAKSIKKYGFKNPVVIDKDNVIVCGHTRYLASQKLGIKDIPCVVADDLTPKQIKEFRLIDNKVSELATWDKTMLYSELADVNLGDFELDWGIELDNQINTDDDDFGYYGDERERTDDKYNLQSYDATRSVGYYDMPIIKGCNETPSQLISFNYVLSTKEEDKAGKSVHFYIDDYQFERLWNEPQFYIEKLKGFDSVITPDFSLYMDMPCAMKIWNIYRARLIGQMMEDAGIKVIPSLTWAEDKTFDYVFDGLPYGSTLATSTVGVMRDKEAQKIWYAGMDEAIQRLHPKKIILYGTDIDYEFGNIEIVKFGNKAFSREG